MTIETLTTKHLAMSPLDATHERLYTGIYSDARVMARIASPLTPIAADRAFRIALRVQQKREPGARTWAVIERSSGRELGIGALHRREGDSEIGLMLRPAGWNGRYSHEVIGALIAHAFDALQLPRLVGICRAGANERMSLRLLQPHGFVTETPDRPGTAQWALDRDNWTRPVGMPPHGG